MEYTQEATQQALLLKSTVINQLPQSSIQEQTSSPFHQITSLNIESKIQSQGKKNNKDDSSKKNKDKPFINFIPLPYCEDSNSTIKSLPPIYKLRRQIDSYMWKPKLEGKQLPPIDVPLGQTPINQYLDFVLTQQINVELRQAKVLAEEVKRIKQLKRKILQKKQQSPIKKPIKKKKQKLVGHSFLLKMR